MEYPSEESRLGNPIWQAQHQQRAGEKSGGRLSPAGGIVPLKVHKLTRAKRTNKLTKIQKEDLARLTALPDDRIDTSDIPEVADFTGWKRGVMYRRNAPNER